MNEVSLKIEGMSCGGCVRNVTAALEAVPGVATVEVSLERGEARVGFDASKVELAALREAIEAAGFDVPA